MKKISYSLFVVFIIVSLLSACAPAIVTEPVAESSATSVISEPVVEPTLEPIDLKIGVYNFISFAPFFIALEEGYFAEQALNLELVDFGSASNEVIPALVSRDLDAAGLTLSVGVFNAILEGNNLKYVADRGFINPANCTTDAWVASATTLTSGALTDVASLSGKNVVFPPGGTIEYAFDVMLAQNGLTQTDVNLSNIQDSAARVEGLNNGSVDVSILSEPWITRAQTAGAGEVWVPFSEIIPNLSMGAVIFGPGILEDKPEAAVRFMVAYLKAVAQFNEGKTDRNVEIIAKFTKLPLEDIQASCWTSFQADGKMDIETVLDFQTWALEKGYVNGPLELDQFWTSQFLEEALLQPNQ